MPQSQQEYEALVERIVREVLRRLEASGERVGDNGDASATEPRELVIAERVVTLERIAGRLGGVRRVVVRSRAVVTPSVRDELRDRKIELVRGPT
jgi:hypothetical protein